MPYTPRSAAQRLKRIAARARTLAIVYFIVLFVGTHLPAERLEAIATASDKWLHFGGYATLTVLVLAGWELTIGVLQPKHYFAVWLAGVFYGAFDEVSQTPVGRHCDMNDWMADVLGVVTGLLVFRLLRASLHKVIAWTSPAGSQNSTQMNADAADSRG
jgi:VanZ family protein